MVRYWIEMALFMHLVLCIIGIYDLFAETKLKKKGKFLLLIFFLPLGEFLVFEDAKKRLRKSMPQRQIH